MKRVTFRENERVWRLRAAMDAAYKDLCSARRPGPIDKIGKLFKRWRDCTNEYSDAMEGLLSEKSAVASRREEDHEICQIYEEITGLEKRVSNIEKVWRDDGEEDDEFNRGSK